jgi:putative nucleotidyltransferase with HDIG domain
MNHVESQTIPVEQLEIGQYVYLDLKWFQHPFAFSHFKIKSDAQIKTIRSLNLKTVRINPQLSDTESHCADPMTQGSLDGQEAPSVADTVTPADDATPVLLAKRIMMEQMQVRRENSARIERAFVDTAKVLRDIEKGIASHPAETVPQATKLVAQIADSILCAPELAIQVMGDELGGDDMYFHSLNVTVLSIMMARDLKIPVDLAAVLGVGALMHDIGRKEVPDKILLKTGPLTQAERNFYELHCQFGADMAQRLKLPAAAIAIVREHHELFDGSGFPGKLKGEEINFLARIVAIANYYDELCNPFVLTHALTPHETLSLMFSRLRSKFDPELLQVLIRCLGVYPPGTVVQLSNGVMGIVVTVNTARPMRPMIMVYDADVPKQEAILLDMERETDFNIAKAIRPSQVARDVYNYLSPRKRVSYYFDPLSSTPNKAANP